MWAPEPLYEVIRNNMKTRLEREAIIASIEEEVGTTYGLKPGFFSSINGTLIWHLTGYGALDMSDPDYEYLLWRAENYLKDVDSLRNTHSDSPNYLDILDGQELLTRRLIERIIYPLASRALATKQVAAALLDMGDGSNEK